MSGDSIILIDGVAETLIVSTRGGERRSIQESSSQVVIRGPHEGFTESISTNIAMVRRIIKSPDLWVETMKIGRVTKTDVSIMYLNGIAKNEVVDEVRNRLQGIKIDSILESGYIEQLIKDQSMTTFPTMYHTERPDSVAGNLLEGRVAIFVDGTPFVLVAPVVFMQFFQTMEDYYTRKEGKYVFTIQMINPGNVASGLQGGSGGQAPPTTAVSATGDTIFSSFAGSMVVFSMIYPYVNHPNKVKMAGILAISLSGITVTIITAMNISVLGVGLLSRTQFPLLRSIQTIDIANFIERLDVFYMFILIIASFISIALFFYVSVSGTASLFNIKKPSQLCYPLGIVVLLLSHIIASDLQEYLIEGGKYLHYTIHLPFQIIIPILLLIIAFVKNRKHKEHSLMSESEKAQTEA